MGIEHVNPKTLSSHPELTPPKDVILDYLLGSALEGHIHLYFAAIPLGMIEPFDASFDPRKHPLGRQWVDAFLSEGQRGQMHNMWVYPRDGKFIMSDDYVTYFACVEGNPEFVPCWVLGEPIYTGVEQVQGPIDPKEIRKIMFGEPGGSAGL